MLIGIVSDFVLHPQHEEWIADKMPDVIKSIWGNITW